MPTVYRLSERIEFLQRMLEVLILRSLLLGANLAYGIAQFLNTQSGHEFVVEHGSLYPALKRLSPKGWIVAEWKTLPNACPAKYYRMPPGRKQLVAATSKWNSFVGAMSRVLAAER